MLENKTVLVVDDDSIIRIIFSETLRTIGMDVIEAESAHHALEALATHTHIDAVITDNVMPGMHGMQLARVLDGRYPLLLISSDDLADAIRQRPDITRFQRKPLTPPELIECVNSLFL